MKTSIRIAIVFAVVVVGCQSQRCDGPFPDHPECEKRIKWMKQYWNKVSWRKKYIEAGVDGSACSCQNYLWEVEGFCPKVEYEQPPAPEPRECLGPFPKSYPTCLGRIKWMMKRWDKVSWKKTYINAGVDGTSCSCQRYLNTVEGYCPPVGGNDDPVTDPPPTKDPSTGGPDGAVFKVAFMGDTGVGEGAKRVMEMLAGEKIDLLVQNGDFDYGDEADTWSNFLDRNLGNIPVLFSQGNHDLNIWEDYQQRLFSQFVSSSSHLAPKCWGPDGNSLTRQDFGELYACEVHSTLFVMVGWGQMKHSNEFLQDTLSNSKARHKFCVWHKPQGKVSSGGSHTRDYGNDDLYEICREAGAVITSGHNHVYSRTKLISSFLGRSPEISQNNDVSTVQTSCGTSGETISIVSGMSGMHFSSSGPYNLETMSRSHIRKSGQSKESGALVCDIRASSTVVACNFYIAQDPSGKTSIDRFTIERKC
mmetsp:Transcript_15529/g.25423  ORF Transcript_15529/g.25423 Transcript_15529/m.25423 type:complete len:476 (+) Transcript_15529:3172-4599(+)|eukprot:CAMPEP_0203762992 /NCGR_PEP_ID=MMETSP0098-20131031/15733_1 /ASSEMBLY_ACC=CAM_ASM_000208 /TAXON_ID=96639 /ORGANISM=" , Strain NY0313808BC1" /LENGTH=475 /DNA_ID=CAMNT_0050657595 /DNA_START=3808 /DNA_END=5238 /DNA_ORIENTATION=+